MTTYGGSHKTEGKAVTVSHTSRLKIKVLKGVYIELDKKARAPAYLIIDTKLPGLI